MLTQTLRALQRDGLVARSVTDSMPPRVEYRLTPLGESLLWAERHIDDIDTARATYDSVTSS